MSNEIHPTAVVDGDVRLGSGNIIGAFAVITGPVLIGDGNWIGAGVVIGAPPEVRSFDHDPRTSSDRAAGVVIGSENVIREYAQIHQGLRAPTTVGDGTFIMNQVYIAHDGRIRDGVTIASSALLAGHVTLGENANIGLGASIHQFRTIGGGAMVGMGSTVTRDIPPYALAYGTPARVQGVNRVGLQRAGVAEATVEYLDHCYSSGESVDLERLDLPERISRAFLLLDVH